MLQLPKLSAMAIKRNPITTIQVIHFIGSLGLGMLHLLSVAEKSQHSARDGSKKASKSPLAGRFSGFFSDLAYTSLSTACQSIPARRSALSDSQAVVFPVHSPDTQTRR